MAALSVGLLGEVQPNREAPETAFAKLAPLIDRVDVTICQLETTFSSAGGHRKGVEYPGHQVDPENVEALVAGNIDVVTFASNTSMDYGGEAMLETIELLEAKGIRVAGAGADLEDARAPVYLERNGVTLAIVNATNAFGQGDRATEDAPGVFAIDGETYSTDPDDAPGNENPGMPQVVKSVPDFEDLALLTETVREADERADQVIAAIHGGVPWAHDITYFQTDVNYALVEAGADAVVGTHSHNLQPVDRHRGRPIFYSMANCVFDEPELTTDDYTSSFVNYYDMVEDPDAEHYITPVHTRDTIFAELGFDGDGGAPTLSIAPVFIEDDATPAPVSLDEEDGRRIEAVLSAISDDIGVTLAREGDRLVIEAADADARREIRKRVLSFPWTYKLREEVFLDRDFRFDDWY